MSDFLSNLVERSLASTGVVRPRLASIFEPPSVNGGALFRGREKPEPPEFEQQNQEPVERAGRISRLQSLRRITTSDLTSPEPAELPRAPLQVRPQVDLSRKVQSVAPSMEHRDSAGAAKMMDKETADELRPGLSTTSSQVWPRVALPGKQQSVAPSIEHLDSAGAAKMDKETADELRPDLPTTSSQVWPRVALPGKQQSVAPSRERWETEDMARTNEKGAGALRPRLSSELITSISNASKPEPRDSTKNRPHERPAGKVVELIAPHREVHHEVTRARDIHPVSQRSPSLKPLAPVPIRKNPPVVPSINVTIGRVEVRATLPPLPSKTPRTSAPLLNLDEYLRQRAAGDRR
jgi:hypothetical protein